MPAKGKPGRRPDRRGTIGLTWCPSEGSSLFYVGSGRYRVWHHSGRRRVGKPITLGADKACDVTDFVSDLRARAVTPISPSTAPCPNRAASAKPPSTRRPAAAQAAPSASAAANASRKSSAGSRRQASHRSRSAANPASTPPLPSHPRRRRLQPHPHPEAAGQTHNLSQTAKGPNRPTQAKAPKTQTKPTKSPAKTEILNEQRRLQQSASADHLQSESDCRKSALSLSQGSPTAGGGVKPAA